MKDELTKVADEAEIQRAVIDTNLAYILADVAHSFAMSAEYKVNRFNKTFMKGSGQQWQSLKQSARWLEKDLRIHKNNCKALANEIYQCRPEFVESGCADSDYLQDLIYLVIDRVADDELKMTQLRSMVYNNFRSILGIYDKK